MSSKDYVLVNKPYDGGPEVFGPYTFEEADKILRAGASKIGDYRPNCGYWSDLPCWWLDDSNVWLMKRLGEDPDVVDAMLQIAGHGD